MWSAVGKQKKLLIMGAFFLLLLVLVWRDQQTYALSDAQKAHAEESCLITRGELPPKPFTSEGCTLFPQGEWGACCVAHDAKYWCGGEDAERNKADEDFHRCVAQFSPTAAMITRIGVFAGGSSWLPTPWRWGYGWKYPGH